MKNTSLLIRRSWLLLVGLLNWFYVQAQDIPLPSQAQLRWQQYEQIMFLCLDPCTWQGREYDNHSYPILGLIPSN